MKAYIRHYCCAICYRLLTVVNPSIEECGLMLCACCEISAATGKIQAEPLPIKPVWESPTPVRSEIS